MVCVKNKKLGRYVSWELHWITGLLNCWITELLDHWNARSGKKITLFNILASISQCHKREGISGCSIHRRCLSCLSIPFFFFLSNLNEGTLMQNVYLPGDAEIPHFRPWERVKKLTWRGHPECGLEARKRAPGFVSQDRESWVDLNNVSLCFSCREVGSSWPFHGAAVLNQEAHRLLQGLFEILCQMYKGAQWHPKELKTVTWSMSDNPGSHHVLRPHVVSPKHFLLNITVST